MPNIQFIERKDILQMKNYLKFTPLLLLYVLFILFTMKDELIGDAERYLRYAENILNGYYTDSDDPIFTAGPGYPLYLTLFLGMNLPLTVAKLSNALLTFIGILFFYETAKFYFPTKNAIISTYLLGLYLPMILWMRGLFTEPLAFVMACGWIYFLVKSYAYSNLRIKTVLMSGFFLGFLALTKFLFIYVIIGVLLSVLFIWIFIKNLRVSRFVYVLSVGLVVSLPYLIYTYSITGRPFYVSTGSGLYLYWMSSSLEGEYGSWISPRGYDEALKKRSDVPKKHADILQSYRDKTYVEGNDFLKDAAIENIKNNPTGYLKNLVYNLSRLWFWYPESYGSQKPRSIMFYIFVHMFYIVLLVFSFYPALKNPKIIPVEIWFMGLFVLIFLCANIAIFALPRFLVPIVPFFVLWITYIYTKVIKISIIRS